MADEKPRAPRARTNVETDTASPAAVAKKGAAATKRQRKKAAAVIRPGDVATRAYLLWEQGEPGDAAAHWIRAEQELAAV